MPTSSPLISDTLVTQFRRDGYCVVSGLFSSAEITEILAFFEEFKSQGDAIYDDGLRYEDVDPKQRQLRAMHPHRYSEQVKAWALNSHVASVLTTLLGHAPLLAQTMYYFKPPGGKGQGMHQDNFYLLAAPATCIAAWTSIDGADLDNGCLYVVPQSNHKSIYCPADGSEAWLGYGDSHIKPFPRDVKPIPVEVPKGATMFFDGNLIHGSGPNRTMDRFRRTFVGHYINEASEKVAKFYHPVLNMKGETVPRILAPTGGGPCGDGWEGATH